MARVTSRGATVALGTGLMCACASIPTEHQAASLPPPSPATAAASAPEQPEEQLPVQPTPPPISRIAVLLPLTGAYSGVAADVQEGFLSGYFLGGRVQSVKFYDTEGTVDGAGRALDAASADDAAVIVGPLTKENVQLIAATDRGRAPIIALNYSDDVSRDNLYEMGLAPEDEAREAAHSAWLDGRKDAMVLLASTDWGRRVGAAFTDEFETLGGVVHGTRTFDEADHDFSPDIRALFGLADSEARHQALESALGQRTKFVERRRDDVDVVFVAAEAETTRMLVPQLRFHHVGGMPIYGTANVNDGVLQSAYRDGLRFCGTPVVLDRSGEHAELRRKLADAFGAGDPGSLRMQGLGFDAYHIATAALRGELRRDSTYSGVTGQLEVGLDGVFRRRLSCVEISRAQLVPLASDEGP